MADDVNGAVRYTAKELFEKIDSKLDVIDSKLDDKIGRAEFDELKSRVRRNEEGREDLKSQLIRIVAFANGAVFIGLLLVNYYLGGHVG